MNIYILLFSFIIVISFLISLLGDIIVIKTKLKKGDSFIAEIIYFDEVHLVKGSSSITIVKYVKNNQEKNAILLKAKKDQIGDKVKIVTDGSLAVRDEIVLKEDTSLGFIFIAIILIFLFSQGNYSDNADYALLALIIMLFIVILLALLHPYSYEAYYSEIKNILGWHNK